MDINVTALTFPLTALATGLLGSVHCLGMCGGISATVAVASPTPETSRRFAQPSNIAFISLPASRHQATNPLLSASDANVLAFNAGRIASYVLAGAMAGTLGGVFAGVGQGWVIRDTMTMRTALFLFANLMIVFTGFYLLGVPQFLAPLEKAGGRLWRVVSPWSRKLLPLRTPSHAALFGMLWGWIPCGMVYAMLLTAMSAGGPAGGAMTMLAFGAGTLPMMVGAGWSAGRLRAWTRSPRVRFAVGMAVIAMGLFGIARIGTLEQLQAFGAFCSSLLPTAASGLVSP